ncbi:MAG: ABC transporter ATP-binding protein [Spirochaetia bacterium]|jgi:peptide/nickel transport system ATP-binding protein
MNTVQNDNHNTIMELKDVTKVFRRGFFRKENIYAVNHISFNLYQGNIVSLIGESGSGKTTTGKMILKLLKPTSGNIYYRGRDINLIKSAPQKVEYYKDVQAVFQEPFASFNPLFRVDRIFDMVFSSLLPAIKSHDEREEQVHTVLRSVHLEPREVLQKYPHQLSGGQLQRLLIARALLLHARILVADELISMLDASTRVGVLNLLGELAYRKGLAVIFITHDLSLGFYMSDKSLIMYNGRLVETGDTEKVYNEAVHPYTKLLLNSVPDIGFRWNMDKEFNPEHIGSDIDNFYNKNRNRYPKGLVQTGDGDHKVMYTL